MLRKWIVLVMLALSAVSLARAGLPETPRPRQLTVADGLPSNRINAITEDQHGYLWIATSDGLARYDGIGYKIWRAEQGLRDNFVWAVHVDAQNRVWLGTATAGLAVLDAQRKQLRYYNRANTPAMGSDDIWSIASTRDGAIWFGTAHGGLHRLSPDGVVTRFMPRPDDARSLPDADVGQLAVAPDDTLWICTKGGVARWTGRDFERMPAAALSSPAINGITVEPDGTLWFGTPRGVGVRRPNGSYSATPWADQGMTDTILHVLLRDRNGSVWLDIPQGLGRESDGAVITVPLYSEAAHGLVRPSWVSAHEDREGGLWFASNSSGLWYLPTNWRQFAVLSRSVDDPTTLGNAHVRGITPSASGDMWLVGSGGVLDRLDPETGRVEHVISDIGGGYILSNVFEDSTGGVWVSYQDGLARLQAATDQLQRWNAQSDTDAALAGESRFAETSDGLVWMATEAGDVQARDRDGRVRESIRPGDGQGLPKGLSIEQIGLAPDGGLWLAGSQGLSMWNAGARRFEPVPGVPPEWVFGFSIDAKNQVWLGRLGNLEAFRWNGVALQSQLRLDAKHGLPLIAPSGLTVDAAGIVWMTSVRGLIRVDPRDQSARVYGVRDGLPSQEFSEPPVLRPGDGRILVGSPEGLTLFDPAVVRPSTETPNLIIESIDARRNDGRVSFVPGQTFSIEHDDRDLRIVARLLSFNDAQTHAYRFRLSPYDSGWVEAGANGERIFSQLKPGKYTLQVKARTADNVWSGVQTVAFEVAPPWWQTWPAIVGFITLSLVLLWWAAYGYRKRLKRRHAWQRAQHEREVTEEASLAKTRFLATLGHEVRTPMTGVLGMNELLLGTALNPQQRGYSEAIRGAGEHLLRLVNDALDLSRIESGKLELADEPFELRCIVDDVVALMGPLALQRGLEFNVDIAAALPRGVLGDASRVRQILLNLLGNAIKFTEHGHLSLRATAIVGGDGIRFDGVRFEITDTGPGLNDEQKARLFRRFEQAEGARTAARYGGSGLGLAICQELTAAMAGQIAVESTPGAGTRFIVELPLPETTIATVAAAAGSPDPRGSRSLTLLLVEDDAMVAEVIAGLLRAQGHQVTHAAHSLAALSEVATAAFDVALLDLDLPGMDGFALARQLRAQGFDAPLVALTARADADAEPLSMASGFDRFIRKPVTGAMLAVLLEACCEPAV